MTPWQSHRASCLSTAVSLYLKSRPEAPKIWGQLDLNRDDYHFDPIEIRSTSLLVDLADRWRQLDQTHSQYTDLSNVALVIFSIISNGIGVEASISLGWDVSGWRQSKTTGETLRENLLARHFVPPNNRILRSTDPEVYATNTENGSEMKKEAEERILHRMGMVPDFLEMWQGSETYRLPRRNLALNTSRWLPCNTFRTWKR